MAGIAIIGLFIILAAAAYYSGQQVKRDSELVFKDAVPGTIAAHKMRMAMSRSIGWVMVAASAQTTQSRDASLKTVHDADDAFNNEIEQYNATIIINPVKDRALLAQVTSAYAEYYRQRMVYEALILSGDRDKSAVFLEQDLVPVYVVAIKSSEKLLDYNHDNSIIYASHIRDSVHRLYWAVGVVMVLALICALVLIINLSIRRRELLELRENEELFRTSFENATVGVCLVAMDGKFLNVNRTWCNMLGYSEDELLQLTFNDVTYEEDKEIGSTFLDNAQSGGSKTLWTEKRYLRKDGQVVWTILSTAIIERSRGKGDYMLSYIQDITERKRADEALRKSNADLGEALAALRQTQQQIVQQESLRALGQMASGIAHDFNNALSPIIGFSDWLLQAPDRLENKEQVVKFLQIINSAAQDAASVVRRMREFSRHRDPDEALQSVDLNKLVSESILLTQPRWKDQAQVEGRTIRVESDLLPVPSIGGEESELRELLTNLIFNAADAISTAGTITVSTEVDGDFVLLRVRDTGIGMTEEVRQRCLEPFFTTKGDKGTGLGLSMVYGIVQRHYSTLEIASTLEQGTTFTIRFPIQTNRMDPVAAVKSVALAQSLRVLVVDDQVRLRDMATMLLTSDGHTVETAEDGEEALVRIKGGHFDLVLTDQAMPKMNGKQLAEAVHAIRPGVSVILMTGFGDLMKATGEMPPYISAILSKPFTLATLREALAAARKAASS